MSSEEAEQKVENSTVAGEQKPAATEQKPAQAKPPQRPTFQTTQFSLVVCRHPNGKFLAVKKHEKGWWLPGGFVDHKSNFFTTAKAVTKAEAGVDVKIEGILRMENTLVGEGQLRLRLVLYGTPVDPNVVPNPQDKELCDGAKWVTLQELREMSETEGLRGPELIGWGTYVQNGGEIYPLPLVAPENAPIPTRKPPPS